MIDHAVSRPAPLVERARSILARLARKKRAFRGEPSYMIVHLHDRPRATARTSVGTVSVVVGGACLYEDALVFRMVLPAEEDIVVESVTIRLGGDEIEVGGVEPLSVKAGDRVRFSWVAEFGDDMGVVHAEHEGGWYQEEEKK